MGRAGGMHSPEQSAQCLGALRGERSRRAERPSGDPPAKEMQVLRADDPLR